MAGDGWNINGWDSLKVTSWHHVIHDSGSAEQAVMPMRKWLRSRFAWRFSLARLLAVVLLLGAIVGLNAIDGPKVQVGDTVYIYSGLPLLALVTPRKAVLDSNLTNVERADRSHWIPWTHRTYSLSFRYPWLFNWSWQTSGRLLIFYIPTAINVLVGIIPLILILTLQIPRRKPPAEGAK